MKLPIHLAMSATSATLFDADDAPAELRITTDTRTLEPGDVFLALHGERFNGHDYLAEAIGKGASMVIIDERNAFVPGTATMVVERTMLAYMSLARLARSRFHGHVIAITGSTGKTTTKVLLAQLLATRFGKRVLAAPGNENNEIGVCKLLLNASDEEHDALVVEIGARHFGDVASLVEVARPDVGILTNIGDAHLEIMGSRKRLEEAKWALFARGARAVLNAEDVASLARASQLAQAPHWFSASVGLAEPVARGRVTALLGSTRLVEVDGERTTEFAVDVRVPGRHNRANLAAALAGALELGVEITAAIDAIPGLQLPPGRFESIVLTGGCRLIYDAYNASAAGTIAALDALADEPAGRRIAMLGSMAELGDEAAALHERVGGHAAGKVDVLLVGGEFGDDLARGAASGGLAAEQVVRVANNGDAARWLRANVRGDDVVLLKGSRKYKLEEIVEKLRA